MKKKNYLLTLFVLTCTILTGCARKASQDLSQNPFYHYDVSFTCPSEWNIYEASESDDGTYYIGIEKSDVNSSGMVMILVLEEEMDLTEFLTGFLIGYQEVNLFSNISEVTEETYGQYKGICVRYTTSAKSQFNEGRIYVFSANGKTVCVKEEEAAEDKEENAAGFETIMESLVIE